MRSFGKRLGALLLALVLVVGICACDGGGDSGSGTHEFTLYPGETPVNLQGYEFTVVDFSNDHWNRDNVGKSPYADAWAKALDEVEGLYNCTITPQSVGPSDLFNQLQPEVAAGGKYADLVITTQWAFGYLIGAGGLLLDLNKLTEVDWDASYWNQNIRRISTIQGQTYAGNGSFIFDTSQTYMLYYNERIWNELALPDPYELVRSGKWTQDKFAEFALKANLDQDGSGTVDSLDDRWGVTTPEGDFTRAMFMGMGGHYYTTNEQGNVELACNDSRTYSIIEKMRKMAKQDRSICNKTGADWPKVLQLFLDGNALFLGNSPGVNELKNMEDDWGVLPMPKLDESQESYYGSVDHNSSVFGVTSANTDLRETGIILNALGMHCQTLENIYWPDYEVSYWRHPEDADIIEDFVVRTGQYDIAILMQNANNTLRAPMSQVHNATFGSASADFASYMERIEPTIEAELEKVFAADSPVASAADAA